jgi:hypothetical protein
MEMPCGEFDRKHSDEDGGHFEVLFGGANSCPYGAVRHDRP